MTDRRIKKSTLDEIIRLTRKYRDTGDVDILPTKNAKAMEASREAFGDYWHWLAVADTVSGVCGISGLWEGASSDVVYRIFESVGIAINDDAPASPTPPAQGAPFDEPGGGTP